MIRLAAVLLAWLAALACAGATAAGPAPVFVVRIAGAIGPATADHVHRALDRAARDGAQLVVLEMDTPGGLDSAMRGIVKDVLAAPLPVAGYVAPQGARAASAGTYILYATHVAAMAQATNLGAATPIAIGLPAPATPPASAAPGHDAAADKRVNDAAAYLRSLAQLRSRNADWAEQAVREAVSLSADEALARQVIDLVAVDLGDLLRQLDGRAVRLREARVATLATAQAPLVAIEPDWRERLLAAISDPSVALVLMMIGLYGLLFEFMSPGFVVPGVIGGVCLLLALWGLQMLPINFAGLALILLGIAFFVAEAFVPSSGALGIGGVAAFAFGALLLIDADAAPGFEIPLALVAGLSLVSAAFVVAVVGMAARARRRPLVSGTAAMLGASGEVLEVSGAQAWAAVAGERWQVRAARELQVGEQVRVTRVDGLMLEVSPAAPAATTGGHRP